VSAAFFLFSLPANLITSRQEHRENRPKPEKNYLKKRATSSRRNFCRIHQTLRITPAMEAGLSDHVWKMEEIVSLLDMQEARRAA